MWYHSSRLAEQLLDTTDAGAEDAFTRALADGEPSALRVAFRQHHEVVRAFARRLLGSDADAEELVQDTFLALPVALRRFRGDCSLRTFILSIAAQRSRNALRSRRRRTQAMKRLEFQPPPPLEPLPDDTLAQRHLAERLQRALECLSHDQRLAFVLTEIEERSSHEVSRILGAPASTLRARVSAAKEKLRRELAREEERS
ncbi:MAG TPA: sigma-70 family RNA polymerase sigma factor [Polyangiaceae bacterium]|nr:sigma-70 family RNA polymerase sigma factor [Polyangiaceae bacterium]